VGLTRTSFFGVLCAKLLNLRQVLLLLFSSPPSLHFELSYSLQVCQELEIFNA